MKHTRIPWATEFLTGGYLVAANGGHYVAIVSAGNKAVANICMPKNMSEEEALANARLLGAAGELFDCSVNACGAMVTAIDIMRKAGHVKTAMAMEAMILPLIEVTLRVGT